MDGHGFLRYESWVALVLLCWPCPCRSAVVIAPKDEAERYAQVYHRTTAIFGQANFLKPQEPKVSAIAFDLAPLILQEVFSPGKQAPNAQLGRLCISNSAICLDYSRPMLYATVDTLEFNARQHLRLSYLWFHMEHARKPALPIQGIRLTLDTSGKPVVWEVLTDTSSAELIFVSKSLEAAARADHGPPLVGRHFAIEPALNDQPNVVVPRVIDDGPMPMGPIVCLTSGTHAVSTLICRCMPAQAREILKTGTYELVTASKDDALLTRAKDQFKAKVSFWPGDERTNRRLETCLRLPRSF